MKPKFLLLVVMCCCMPVLAWSQDVPVTAVPQQEVLQQQADTVQAPSKFQQMKSSITKRINDKLNEPYDTTRDGGYWWRAMKHGKVNFNDSTMRYPKFVRFCYNLYKWGDKAFNSYDTAYVVSTGKNWKLTLKNQNWIDNFDVGNNSGQAIFTSGMASNLGVYLSFMAVSVGYSIDVDRIFGAKGTSEMMEFSFTCARFTAEAHRTKNTGRMSTRVKVAGGDWQRGDKMNALQRETIGVSATYFFNNRKYARAAAYCFSKFQRRSAGSALAGFSVINYDFKVDTEQLTPLQAQDFEQVGIAHVRYTDYCLKGGYAQNWVLNNKLLLNATGMVGAGVKHIHSTMYMPSSNNGAINLDGSLALTYNHKRYFASAQTNINTSLYFTGENHFSYTIAQFIAVLGIRF